GFSFDHGGFQAVDHGGGPSSRRGLRAFSVGPAPPENVEHAFARVGESIFVLDLRSLAPDDPARRWLDVPRPLREIGNGFFDETSMSRQYRLTERFDAIVFIAETTSARSL
ncbi:MAG: erythromycin esterase family protein, partial [Candidatus Eisenbacteria bacterium]|nr:erythromycin esterase family protein [Candidatus Eisenbacteria bacterium]